MQFTPPGSPASIQFGDGLTTMTPGSLQGMYLVVEDIQAARDDLIGPGRDVSDVWHGGARHRARRRAATRSGTSYRSCASFSDPDGNRWLLQEITERLPGRV